MGAAMSIDDQLIAEIAKCYDDPLRYVMLAFPWGVKGTALENHDEPDQWQKDQLNGIRDHIRSGKEVALRDCTASGHGIGKGHPLNLVIDTPSGKMLWRDVVVGTKLFGSDGKAVTVTAVHPKPVQQVYKVAFDDGSFTLVDADHIWTVRGRNERRTKSKAWRNISTTELIKLGVKRKNGVSEARQWEIPAVKPVEYEAAELPVNPYLAGLYLGDGCYNGTITLNGDDNDVRERSGLETRAERKGLNATVHPISQASIRAMGLDGCRSWEKFIPDQYRYSSVNQRMALLRGLMDSDGECNTSGTAIYNTTSEQLRDDVVWLVRSLGGKAMVQPTPKKGKYKKDGEIIECRDCYRVTVTTPFNPFFSERKAERYTKPERRYLVRWIDSIEPYSIEETKCVSVDAADMLYCANDFIVTHNSAETAWIILWFMSTRPHCAGVVTANTMPQLKSKTWRELSLWHQRSINKHWFEWTATRFQSVESPETWGIDAIAWTENNSESFAGLHAKDVLVVFDEASNIADIIWEVTEGAMTTAGAFWLVYGNPTRNTGRFRECFRANRKYWITRQIDSRTCKMTNKAEIEAWSEQYGEDSDFMRVRVKGDFPRVSSNQLIPSDSVAQAAERVIPVAAYSRFPTLLGVDVARFGDDSSVLIARQGDKVFEPVEYQGINTMQLAANVVLMANKIGADCILVDGVGVGGGVVDRLVELGMPVIDVQSSESALDKRKYKNKRAELWCRMADAIEDISLPTSKELIEELSWPEYGYDGKLKIQIESTDDIKKREGRSPDFASALAMTYEDGDKIALAMGSGRNVVARNVKNKGLSAWT